MSYTYFILFLFLIGSITVLKICKDKLNLLSMYYVLDTFVNIISR